MRGRRTPRRSRRTRRASIGADTRANSIAWCAALSPSPGAWFEVKGERIKVFYAEPIAGKGAPGEVLHDLTIASGDGALALTSVQRAGGKAMDAATFLRGFPLKSGERVG